MEQKFRSDLLELAGHFAQAKDVSLRWIGQNTLHDNTFFHRIADDPKVTFTVRTYSNLMLWFSANWPEGAVWPANISRPFVEREAETAVDADKAA